MKISSNLKSSINISKTEIGENHPVYIVVETGVTASGSLDIGKSMIDIAYECGADAIKFQTIDVDEFMSDRSVLFKYETVEGIKEENMYEMLKKHQYTPSELIELSNHARRTGITFYLSVDTIRSVAWAEEAKVAAYKIGSWDLRNFPLLEAVAKTGKPIQIDLGPVVLGEIVQVLEFLESKGAREVMLVHCSHAEACGYLNLETISYLRDIFNIPIGYSADTREYIPDVMAIALGAKMIEKRLTMDCKTIGHHHIKALEPQEFMSWIGSIRKAEAALGVKGIKPSINDLKNKSVYFTSIVASRDIMEGELISPDMLKVKRPGTGISPLYMDQMIGKRLNKSFKKDEIISWGDWGNFT